jgi:hypothetical protein
MIDDTSKADKKDKFIELRAKEYSYDYIAKELSVSKVTLISWSKFYNTDVSNLREITRESLREKYRIGRQHRIEVLSEQLSRLKIELSKRDLSEVPTPQLLTLYLKVDAILIEIDNGNTILSEEESSFSLLDTTKINSWNG